MHPMYMVQSFLFPKPGAISETGLAVGTVGELHDDVAFPGCGLKSLAGLPATLQNLPVQAPSYEFLMSVSGRVWILG